MMADPFRLSATRGIAIIMFDQVDQPVNLISPAVWRSLDGMLDRAEKSAGVVLASGKPNAFCAGADIGWLAKLTADPARRQDVAFAHEVIKRMLSLPVPLVAAIDGTALGGGLELALACHARVATDRDAAQLGLPEVTLGLMPGGGATQILPRLVQLDIALEMLLTGRSMTPDRALECGLVDGLASDASLLDLAVEKVCTMEPLSVSDILETPRAFDAESLAHHVKNPPPGVTALSAEAIGEAITAGLTSGVWEGLRVEAECFERVCWSSEAAARLHLFLVERAVHKQARRRAAGASRPHRMFILGGGMMGSGIAAEAIDAGIVVRIRDVDPKALVSVHRVAERVLARRGRSSADPVTYGRDRIHRLSTTTGYSGLKTADVVIEAVYEDTALKHEVIAQVEPHLKPEAVFASNTSAIPISVLASKAEHPERFVGMHFFSPVDRMQLLEVIPHTGTDPEVVSRALSAGLALGKLPIVVSDSPGFFTSRVYGRWLDEGTRLLLDGASIEQIDGLAKELGFPVGPLLAQDEVSIHLVQKIAKDPMTANITTHRVQLGSARQAIDRMVASGHGGRKSGRGWYAYDEDGRRIGVDDSVYTLLELHPGRLSDDEVRDRVLYAFVTEALLCLDEGIIHSPEDGDLASVLGIGFPRDLGGPFHYVEDVGRSRALETIGRLDQGTGNFSAPAL